MTPEFSPVIAQEAWPSAEIIWRYMRLVHEPRPVEFILCLGTNDIHVAHHAAKLWHEGHAKQIIMTGGLAHQGDLARTGWDRPEAVVFAEAAERLGVPRSAILLENQATNTGDNFQFARALISNRRSQLPKELIVVAKPYMTRRGFATGCCVWPGVTLHMQCEEIGLREYLGRWNSPARILNLMVGDLHRIMAYPALGFQIPQEVPAEVSQAFETLVSLGYRHHLIPGRT